MDPLATVDDVIARSPRELTDEELVRVSTLLEDVSANVRRASTQHFTPGTSTVTVTPSRRGRVRLPQRPVTTVTSVEDLAGNDLAYRLVGDEVRFDVTPLNAWEIEPYRCPPTEIVVTYEHGAAEVPPLIVGIVCAVVLRALGQDPTQAGIQQETIDGYSATYGTVGAGGALALLPSETEILDAYRRPRSAIRTAP